MDETEKENMELLSVEEAAAYLKFSTTFLYRLAREKKIPHVNYGRYIIFRKSDLYNWLIQGFKMWKKEGLCEEPDAIKNANEEYRMDMDSVGTFIMECFTIDASMKIREGNTQVYNTYLKWCTKNNERALSQKSLTIRMQEKGFKRCVSNSQRFWLGLVMKNEWRI